MVLTGEAPQKGSAAAAASLRRRRAGSSGGTSSRGASTMLQFYTDCTLGQKMSPKAVLIISVGFVAVVSLLHVFGKLFLFSS